MDTREHDLETLRKDYKVADGQTRKLIERAAQKIRHEDGMVKSMRESLIKEHRKRDKDNIRDIHEYTASRGKYRNE